MSQPPVLSSPLLKQCPASLPARAYRDPEWYARERARIWSREWVHAGRLSDLPEHTLRRIEIAGEPVVIVRGRGTRVSAFLNVCRHRGSELCGAEDRAARHSTGRRWSPARKAGRWTGCPAAPTFRI